MQILKVVFIVLCVLYFMFYIYAAFKTEKPIKTILFYAFVGVVTLFIINQTSSFTGVCIDINKYTLLGSCVASIPGIITFLILNLVFMI